MELNDIISQFLPDFEIKNISKLGNGLIHKTYLVDTPLQSYILQNINQSVFNQPEILVRNHFKINENLENNDYQYQLSKPLKTFDNQLIFQNNQDFWRMTEYIKNTTTYQKVESPEMAYDASKALSHFHLCINNSGLSDLEESIPDFINFEKRMNDFSDNKELDINRFQDCFTEIAFANKYASLSRLWIDLTRDGRMQKRIIHADPKISNILFDKDKKPVAIIDLDTVFMGYILYDFGDMIRSYTNKTDENDHTLVDNFDPEIYEAVKEGFLFHTEKSLTDLEKDHLDYAAKIVVYIQAIRFLMDHIKGNVYYDVDFDGQNLHRAKNQINLLKAIMKYVD